MSVGVRLDGGVCEGDGSVVGDSEGIILVSFHQMSLPYPYVSPSCKLSS